MRPIYYMSFLLISGGIMALISTVVYQVLRLYAVEELSFIPDLYAGCAIVFPILLIATMAIGNTRYHTLIAWTYRVSIFWIPLLLWLFITSLFLAPLYALSVQNGFTLPLQEISSIVLVCLIVFLGAGILQALRPKVLTRTLSIPALRQQWAGKKIAVFSDVHLGAVRNKNFLKKIVRMVNAQEPDLILIAGDLIDGPAIKYEEVLSPLSELKSTFGTFFTSGNHDQYNRHPETYYGTLRKHLTILDDAKVTVNETELIGIAYGNELKEATKNRLRETLFENSAPSIALLHDPKNAEALAEAGVSLILSGHTHAGQFFPFTLIVQALYRERAQGIYRIGESTGFTTVGVGTAGPLLRIGNQPEVVILSIE